MKIAILIVVFLAFLVWAGPFDGFLPKKYRKRICAGKSWKKAFPDIPKEEIRSFLFLFSDAFAFSPKNKLKFVPEDKVSEIYRELYPSKWCPDVLELETLAKYLEMEYGVSLSELWHEQLTLGELFSKVSNA